ncbi:hypothetical protein WME98_13815 [Sorangium sp. So ce296]|uniref:hypothetical protein n=1 Tax=Sorangium sp. So ce296 TaxID=3133296 RepID=UPI003F60D4E5
MASYGYSFVTDKAFSAFSRDLEQGAWKSVSIAKYDVPNRVPTALLLEAPKPVIWKARALWSIATLDEALGVASAAALAELDTEWDAAQRALHLFLASAAESKDPAQRDAAVRLRGALLAGAGTEQTRYTYDAEVDYGWHQVAVAGKAPLAADVKKVGAGPHLRRVEEATEALAKGLGRSAGQKRAVARSKRIREAVAACTQAFNGIHDDIGWLIEHTPSGKQRELLEALHAPFLALLERSPQPQRGSAAAAPEEEEAEEDAAEEDAAEPEAPESSPE